MYCKYCGEVIDDDSVFCNYCGKRVDNKPSQTPKNNNTNSTNNTVYCSNNLVRTVKEVKESSGVGLAIFTFFIVIAIIFGGLAIAFKVNQNADSKGNIFDKITERSITKNDYYVTTNQDVTAVIIIVSPLINIKYCDVECKVYDDDNSLIYIDTISKSDLLKNKTYSYTFDYGTANAFFADHFTYNITGKCVG